MFEPVIDFIRQQFATEQPIPLHEPCFSGREQQLVAQCIDSTFVSSVGQFVTQFEQLVAAYTGSKHAIAVVNGTQALFTALTLLGARRETEVITQSLTFVATANAISNTGATPVFVDVDRETLGMSPAALKRFLRDTTVCRDGKTFNRTSGREIVACLPMHTLGHPCRIDEIVQLCDNYTIPVIEDAAESLGSCYQGQHTGSFGRIGTFSFNGNKIITTGGGGMLVTDDEHLAQRARHLTTTAKLPHRWEFLHDEIGYNFRLPNLNAALGVAQMEVLPKLVEQQRKLAAAYRQFFQATEIDFIQQPAGAVSNYWLNAILLKDRSSRDAFLEQTNNTGIMTRALWRPMHQLDIYRNCQHDGMEQTNNLYNRIVNLPSSVSL